MPLYRVNILHRCNHLLTVLIHTSKQQKPMCIFFPHTVSVSLTCCTLFLSVMDFSNDFQSLLKIKLSTEPIFLCIVACGYIWYSWNIIKTHILPWQGLSMNQPRNEKTRKVSEFLLLVMPALNIFDIIFFNTIL